MSEWLERTARYVPSEVIAAYVAAEGLAESAVGQRRVIWHGVIFFACLLITPFYIARFASTAKAKWINAVVATVSFVIWSYSVGAAVQDGDSESWVCSPTAKGMGWCGQIIGQDRHIGYAAFAETLANRCGFAVQTDVKDDFSRLVHVSAPSSVVVSRDCI